MSCVLAVNSFLDEPTSALGQKQHMGVMKTIKKVRARGDIAIIFITVPVFAPVVRDMAPELGMEPEWAAVWFGVLFVMNIQIYFLSPPFGPACFWLKSVAPKDVTLQEIFLSVLPFIVLQIIGMLLVMFFPQIALFLPQLLS